LGATSVLRYVDFRLAWKGYNVEQVDEHLEGLATKLDRGEELFAEDVTSNEFRMSWKGYQKGEVDEFLERLAATVNLR
jgi:DivIVA domain-containing protein